MSPTPTNPAALLREAADRAREIGDPLHTALALWLNCEQHMAESAHLWTEREACGWCDTPAAGHALTVARQILGTSVCPECGTSGACNGCPCPLGTTTGQPATAPWPPAGVERPDHELYVTLRKHGLDPAPAQQMIDTYTQTILAGQGAPAVDRATVLNEAADALEKRAADLTAYADERASDALEDRAQEWVWAAAMVRDMTDGAAAEAQQPTPDEDESCGRFVPDTPRAPGLCASCGDAKGWHSLLATAEPATPPAAPAMPEESKPAVRMCPAKHGKWGRICDQADGHTGFHSGPIPNGGVTWEGDAP
ncbi:hypothetical protein ACFW9I_02625 [[Kitasatospora] papulosa]|uniref:hypothetical protein n=1 Tax=[Kitasatospora] papulosa TaxID=1464011 RepID=UPI0036BAB880